MNLHDLHLFVLVANSGGFTAAARRLGADPSLVSRTIGKLERELGFHLFNRSTRTLALTSAGAAYLHSIVPLLDDLKQAEEAARLQNVEPEGCLKLTASTAFGQVCLLPLMPEFRALYPKVQLDLHFTDAVLDILAEQIDLACRLASRADPNLVAKKLFSTRFCVFASPKYLAHHSLPTHPDELAAHKILAFNLPGFRARWLFTSAVGETLKVPIQPDIMVSNALAIRDATLRGMGIAMLASWLVDEELKKGNLVHLFPEYQVTATDFNSAAWLLYPSRPFMPAKTRVMIDFLTEKLG